LDLGSIIGIIAGAALMLMSMVISADYQFARLQIMWNLPSFVLVIGGSMAAIVLGNPFSRVVAGLKAFMQIFKLPDADPAQAITNIINLANMARKEGILSLEDAVTNMEDQFLKKGIMLIVDGTDPELVRNILETEMAYIEGRHADSRGVWEFLATSGPAWGMIGTLIGLVLMLQDLNDLAALGPNMAVAIITTLYGSIIANYFANPVANKLKVYNGVEIHIKQILVEGILSIQAGENPRIIEEKLRAFLSPDLRTGMEAADAKGGEA